jgi:hypothetical protein
MYNVLCLVATDETEFIGGNMRIRNVEIVPSRLREEHVNM